MEPSRREAHQQDGSQEEEDIVNTHGSQEPWVVWTTLFRVCNISMFCQVLKDLKIAHKVFDSGFSRKAWPHRSYGVVKPCLSGFHD